MSIEAHAMSLVRARHARTGVWLTFPASDSKNRSVTIYCTLPPAASEEPVAGQPVSDEAAVAAQNELDLFLYKGKIVANGTNVFLSNRRGKDVHYTVNKKENSTEIELKGYFKTHGRESGNTEFTCKSPSDLCSKVFGTPEKAQKDFRDTYYLGIFTTGFQDILKCVLSMLRVPEPVAPSPQALPDGPSHDEGGVPKRCSSSRKKKKVPDQQLSTPSRPTPSSSVQPLSNQDAFDPLSWFPLITPKDPIVPQLTPPGVSPPPKGDGPVSRRRLYTEITNMNHTEDEYTIKKEKPSSESPPEFPRIGDERFFAKNDSMQGRNNVSDSSANGGNRRPPEANVYVEHLGTDDSSGSIGDLQRNSSSYYMRSGGFGDFPRTPPSGNIYELLPNSPSTSKIGDFLRHSPSYSVSGNNGDPRLKSPFHDLSGSVVDPGKGQFSPEDIDSAYDMF